MLKKYWSHILNIVYLGFVDAFIGFCLFAMNNEEQMEGVPFAIMPIMLLVELVLTFAVLGEIIYGIVKAIQDKDLSKKTLHIVLIYFLNLLYIPCFFTKYVNKDEKALVKNIVYLIIAGALYITLFVLAVSIPMASI